MNNGLLARSALMLTAVLASGGLAYGDQHANVTQRSVMDRFVGDRLAIGARLSHWWLEDSRRYGEDGLDNGNPGNFLGSLWGLDAEQGGLPLPFVEYRVISRVGVGAAYDEVRINTLDWGNNDERTTTVGDGYLRLRGIEGYAFARLTNRTPVTPCVRAGWAQYWSAFFEDSRWAMPGRSFEVQESSGWFVAAGIGVALRKHVEGELSFEHSALSDVRAKARLLNRGHKNGAFPVRSDTLRLGVSYRF